MEEWTPTAQSVAEYYEKTGLQYRLAWSDRYLHYGFSDTVARTHRQALERMVQQVVEAAPPEHGNRVLDAGCGVGGLSLWLVRHYTDLTVLGITLSKAQVARAQGAARRVRADDRAQFMVADYTAVPEPAASFDRIYALESVCHAASKAAFADEAARLLRPGGHLVIADFFRVRAAMPEDENLVRRWCAAWSIPYLEDLAEMRRHLRHAGLTVAKVRDISVHVAPSAARLYRRAKATRFPVHLLGRLRLLSPEETANHRGALLQAEVFHRDIGRYVILSARK